jgi:hypothetical protein
MTPLSVFRGQCLINAAQIGHLVVLNPRDFGSKLQLELNSTHDQQDVCMSASDRTVQISLFAWLAVIVTLLLPGCNFSSQSIQPFVSSCRTDSEISAKDLASVDKAAIDFVQNALGPNPEAAYLNFTAEAKKNVSSEKFVLLFKQSIQPMGPFKNLRVAHAYLAQVTGGTHEQRIVCGNLSRPETWVAVNAKPGSSQGYVIVEAQTLNNTWAFVLWLLPEEGNWHVQYSQAMATAMVGKTAEDLQRMAESEMHENHNFDAYILYTTALQLAARGPFLQLGIQPEIQKALENLKPPPVLQGQLPFDWKFGQASFRVLNIGPVGVSQKIYLQIDQEIEPWADDKDADKKNHELISAFSNSYPEYKHAFAGLIVRAHERGGNRLFGTVFETDAVTK